MKNIVLPHAFSPRPYQLNLLKALDNGVKRAVICWHRRSGKDKTCFNYMVKEAMIRKGTYFYFLPSYTQAKRVVWDNIDNDGFKMLDHIPKELIVSSNATELKIELVNGSIIQLIAADEFKKSGVGTNPIGVVFSEYSITDPDAWKFVSPILAVNGGWAIFNFTPRGTNHAWELLQKAKDNNKWFWQVLTADDTKVLPQEVLDEEKRNNPQDFFEQEFYCKFVDGAAQFFKNVEGNLWNGEMPPEPGHQYQMGVDLAKYQDYTVITIIDLCTFKIAKQERFNQIDYNLQKAKIEALYYKYYKPQIYIDSTGVGDPIYEDLANKGLMIIPYRFTEQTRKDLLVNIQLILEQGRVKLPNDPILISEAKAFQYVMKESGRVKIQVPDGMHDDTIFSLGLALQGLPRTPITPLSNSSVRLAFTNFSGDNTSNTSYV